MSYTLSSLKADWSYPTDIRFGVGRVKELAAICDEFGLHRPLFVSDAGLIKLPLAQKQVQRLQDAGLQVTLFSDFHPNPVYRDVVAGLQIYRQGYCDGIVAFGGGSSLDVGKAIAFAAAQDHDLAELLVGRFEEVPEMLSRAKGEIPTIIAVPSSCLSRSKPLIKRVMSAVLFSSPPPKFRFKVSTITIAGDP